MSVDFTGITNENEFYTNFYFAALFPDEVKSELKNRDKDLPTPKVEKQDDKKPTLRALYEKFFKLDAQLRKAQTRENALQLAAPFVREFLNTLGYQTFNVAQTRESANDKSIPIIAEVKDASGAPKLWALEIAPDAGETEESSNPASKTFLDVQFVDEFDPKRKPLETPVEELLGAEIFNRKEPPRFVLIVRYDDVVLVDRSKWNDKRYLRFDLCEILARRDSTTLDALDALLNKRSLCPDVGSSLLDAFDEKSNQHARSVSDDLKYAARKAVELMGNEAAWYLREKHLAYGDELAQKLTQESLRYLYRLLFVFFLEARSSKLPYLPMNNEAYRTGYSLESLRDLELNQTTDDSENGYFLDESIRLLFKMIYDGCYPSGAHDDAPQASLINFEDSTILRNEFRIERLESALFDPERTPTLNGVKFRNKVWQEIIRLLSLTREKSGKKSRRGRVSYATLGVSQLGAVYEGLLSYSGFFAKEDLYEVKKKDKKKNGEQDEEQEEKQDKKQELKQGFFVTREQLKDYDKSERVYDEKGNLVVHKQGEFIYRLAGRDREKSASYYTPEQLTQCLVKYSLRELIGEKQEDSNYKTADEILKLTVCEPAMGSATFLNEAINQLTDAYLKRKQTELGEFIPADRLERETQKVRAYFADRNVFGVDLNPIAVELGEISLWLNSICGQETKDKRGFEIFVPWFGGQLVCGNSLVGARRQVYPSSKLLKKGWHDLEPIRVEPGQTRPKGTVYHFLLLDPGMAKYEDKVVKGLAKAQIATIDDKRKEYAEPYTKGDVLLLEKISDKIDELWTKCVVEMREFRAATTDALSIFGREESDRKNVPLHEKETRYGTLRTKYVKSSTPYRCLQIAMDYWCALWFWPIEKAELLPNRSEFLFDIQFIFQGELDADYSLVETIDGQPSFLPIEGLVKQLKIAEEIGPLDVDKIREFSPRVDLACNIAEKEQRFLHWELEFADIFADNGGFDLIVGNPPWVKVTWNEGGIISDYEPGFVIHKLSASRVAELRNETLENPEIRKAYFDEYVVQTASKNFLNATVNYAELRGQQTNLFKCFLPTAWKNIKNSGVVAFVHPEGVYDDSKGGRLRKEIYSRLRYHFQFVNEDGLFPDVEHLMKFSVNIYGSKHTQPCFAHISNLFASSTIDESFEKTSTVKVGGIKDEQNDWNTRGHQDRVIKVTPKELATFAKLYDEPGTPFDEARLPSIHARQLLDVLDKFAAYPKRLGDIQGEYKSLEMWHETNAQKDGTIRRETRFPETPRELILQGPHFYVGNQFYKSPREICEKHSDYDSVCLTELPQDYLPRTNYVPDCSSSEYVRRTPEVPWGNKEKVTDYYRLIFRAMLSQTGERTLTSSICPKNVGHINGVQSVCFQHTGDLISTSALSYSLIADYFIKSTGKSNLHFLWTGLPRIDLSRELAVRTLLLTCLTNHYAELWRGCWNESFMLDGWTLEDDRLPRDTFSRLSETWSRSYPLRSDFSRRQALIEIDVLVARAINLTIDDLCEIYRIQFPVLYKNEKGTWYDRTGRIAYTCSDGLTDVGFIRDRKKWNAIKDSKSGEFKREVTDAWLPGAPKRTITYYAPFDVRDREADYRAVWDYFNKH